MALRNYTLPDWFKLMRKSISDDDLWKSLQGQTVASVAKKFDISVQAVTKAIHADRLDALCVTDKNGRPAIYLVTEASLEKFRVSPSGRATQKAFYAHE